MHDASLSFWMWAVLLVFSGVTIAVSLYPVHGTLCVVFHVALSGIDLQAPMMANSQGAERA